MSEFAGRDAASVEDNALSGWHSRSKEEKRDLVKRIAEQPWSSLGIARLRTSPTLSSETCASTTNGLSRDCFRVRRRVVDDRKAERNLNPIAAERVDTSVCIVHDDIGGGSSASSTQAVYSLSEDGCFRRTADEVHTGSSVLSVLNGICPQKASMHHPNDGLIDSLRQPSRIKDNEYVEDVADESRLLLFLLRTETVASPTLSRLLFAPTSEKNRRDSQTNENFSHQNGEIRGSGSREASR